MNQETSKKSLFGLSPELGKRLGSGLIIALCSWAIALSLWSFGLLEDWEAETWDIRARMMAKPGKATDKIRLILLDQNSLDWGAKENGLSWPWPREVYSAIVNFCLRSGASGFAMDVLFTEPSSYGREDDLKFGESISRFGRVVLPVFLSKETGSVKAWPEKMPDPTPRLKSFGLNPDLSKERFPAFPKAAFPIPEITAGAFLANVHQEPDPDGKYRRIDPLAVFDSRLIPSLGLAAFLDSPRARTQELQMHLPKVPFDHEDKIILNFRGPSGTHKTYSAAAIIQSELQILSHQKPAIDPAELSGRFVFFGFSAPGLLDLRPTPVSGVYPGVEIHATALDNFLSDDFIREIPRTLQVAIFLLVCLLAGLSAVHFSTPMKTTAVFIFFSALPALTSLAAYRAGLKIEMIFPLIGTILTLILVTMHNYATEGRQKRFIKQAFKQYLSPAVIEEIIANPGKLKLGGERKVISIFFSDLQGFTTISEGLEPEELTALLNEYLSAMTDIIHQEGGTVDKYEGDAIIAFWNAPLPQPDHAIRAVRASLRCQTRLAEMRPAIKNRIGKDLFMRIGLNTGPAVVGNMGSSTRFDYTMLGDSVNLAARLEGINKQYGTYLMVSRATFDACENAFPGRELSRVAVVGRKEPVVVYEPMNTDEYERRKPDLEIFDRGLHAYYEGRFEEAVNILETIRTTDPAADAYFKKCRELLKNPPAEWKGVWVMTSK